MICRRGGRSMWLSWFNRNGPWAGGSFTLISSSRRRLRLKHSLKWVTHSGGGLMKRAVSLFEVYLHQPYRQFLTDWYISSFGGFLTELRNKMRISNFLTLPYKLLISQHMMLAKYQKINLDLICIFANFCISSGVGIKMCLFEQLGAHHEFHINVQ